MCDLLWRRRSNPFFGVIQQLHIQYWIDDFVFFGQVAERKSELAKLESIDCGKPIDEAEWDMVLFTGLNSLFMYLVSVSSFLCILRTDHLHFVVGNYI